jgi:hypothetical protein
LFSNKFRKKRPVKPSEPGAFVRPSWEIAFLISHSSGILQIELFSASEITREKRESSSSSKEGFEEVNRFWKYSEK